MMQFQFIPAGDNRLAASIDLPDDAGGGALPTVIVNHGLTGQRIGKSYHLVEFARRLNARGIACLRFDQGGCGESTGRFVDLTIPRMVDDLRAVRAWAVEQPWCDGARLGFVGLSLGALPVVAVEGESPGVGVALWAPVYDMPRVFGLTARTGLRALVEHQGWVPYRGLRFGAEFVRRLDAVDTPNELARSGSPMLVFHARNDDTVPFAESESYRDRCAALGRPFELAAWDRADHDFGEYEPRQELLGRTVEFFGECVARDAGG